MVSAVALVLCCLAVGAHAQKWTAVLEAANQVPPLTDAEVDNASGTFTLSLDGGPGEWTLEAVVQGLTMAHIHLGNASTNGPPVVILVPADGKIVDGALPMLDPPFSGTYAVASTNLTTADFVLAGAGWTWDEFIEAADTSNLYVNLHTVAYPGGAIRGQLLSLEDEPVAPEPEPVPSAATAATPLALAAAALLATVAALL